MRDMTSPAEARLIGSLSKSIVSTAIVIFSLTAGASAQDAGTKLFNYPDTVLNGITSAEISKTLEECRKICSSRPGCVGFDHFADKGTCRIFASVGSAKTAVGGLAETRSLITGYHEPTNPPLAGRLEKLKQSDSDGSELLALSHDAFAQGDRDIANQAIQLSLQRGNADAKIEIAKWYDPRTFAADRAAAIDTNKAARSYFELALEGNSEAAGLLTSLCREANNSGSAYTSSFESFLGSTYCEGSLTP